eukprot:COSAG06_NODE_4045_length_4634_cov_7.279603_1_plen_714_part_00
MQLVRLLLSDNHGRRYLDEQTEYGYTALHLACIGHTPEHTKVVQFLIGIGCNTALTTVRAKTSWDLAELSGNQATLSFLHTCAEEQDTRPAEGTPVKKYKDLSRELERRQSRPLVTPTREDLHLKADRFVFWSLDDTYIDWEEVAEGGFGKVYRVPVFPPIHGAGGHRYEEVAIKAAKVTDEKDNLEFTKEITGLAQLSHEHIVSILGFTYSKSPTNTEKERWLMMMEYCHSDTEKLLYGDDDSCTSVMHAIDRAKRSPRELMLALALQISQGMQYIHGTNTQHLDLKLENVLLRRVKAPARNDGTEATAIVGEPGWQWQAKIADFGMEAEDDHQPPGDGVSSLIKTSKSHSELERPNQTSKTWVGTYEYMSPEATGQNCERFGDTVEQPADVYSFGIMIWEMIAGQRVRTGFAGRDADNDIDYMNDPKTGGRVQNLKTVARWMLNGERPQLYAAWPLPLRLLIKACWTELPDDRIDFQVIVPALEALCTAPKGRVLDTDLSAGALAAPQQSYCDWLGTLGLQDKKDELAEWDVREGEVEAGPLEKLQVMLQEERDDEVEDFKDMLEDVFEGDEEAQAQFRQAVEQLKTTTAVEEQLETTDLVDELVCWIKENVGDSQGQAVLVAYNANATGKLKFRRANGKIRNLRKAMTTPQAQERELEELTSKLAATFNTLLASDGTSYSELTKEEAEARIDAQIHEALRTTLSGSATCP